MSRILKRGRVSIWWCSIAGSISSGWVHRSDLSENLCWSSEGLTVVLFCFSLALKALFSFTLLQGARCLGRAWPPNGRSPGKEAAVTLGASQQQSLLEVLKASIFLAFGSHSFVPEGTVGSYGIYGALQALVLKEKHQISLWRHLSIFPLASLVFLVSVASPNNLSACPPNRFCKLKLSLNPPLSVGRLRHRDMELLLWGEYLW